MSLIIKVLRTITPIREFEPNHDPVSKYGRHNADFPCKILTVKDHRAETAVQPS